MTLTARSQTFAATETGTWTVVSWTATFTRPC
jgi:hypothetical protein